MLALLFHLFQSLVYVYSVIHFIIYSNLLCDLLLGVAVFFGKPAAVCFKECDAEAARERQVFLATNLQKFLVGH